jgi:hypothetical protein
MRYEQRVRLLCALGLDNRWFAPLKVLGDIRNAFGHRLNTRLSDELVNSMYKAFSDADRDGFMLGVKAALPTVTTNEAFVVLPPKTRFVFLAVALDKMLADAKIEFQQVAD